MRAARSAAPAPSATPPSIGGTLAPGNSIGTLTINGNLVLSAAAAYAVEIGAVSADRTHRHRHGIDRRHRAGGLRRGALAAALHDPDGQRRRRSAFSARLTSVNLPAGVSASLTYDPNNVYLNLTAVLGFGQGLNQNQQNVATSLNTVFNGGGALSERFGALFCADRQRTCATR